MLYSEEEKVTTLTARRLGFLGSFEELLADKF